MAIKSSNQITFTEQKRIIEIKEWYLTTDNNDPNNIPNDAPWSDSVQQTDATNRYLWNYEEVIYSIGDSEKSPPVIISVYGGIKEIINYYGTTEKPTLPEFIPSNFWHDDFDQIVLSRENKYLWNYEVIIYADGTTNETKPAIIGIYGDNGEDAVLFKIYSVDGFEFIDSVDEAERLDTINLQLSTFKGNKPLNGARYTWSYWNPDLNDKEGGYQNIDGYVDTDKALFPVNSTDEYAFLRLRCEMTFEGNVDDEGNPGDPFVDYITLSKRNDFYNATIKFLNGTNVFEQNEEYVIAYVELYKNNELEETALDYDVYPDVVTLDENSNIKVDYTPECGYIIDDTVDLTSTGIYWIKENENYISKTLPNEYDSNETYYVFIDEITTLTWFVYQADNRYDIALGQYSLELQQWKITEQSTDYIYVNNLGVDTYKNIFIISKSDVVRSVDLNVDIYMDITTDEDIPVTSTHATIVDLNDAVVGDEPPLNPYYGQLWLDTAHDMLKIYNGDAWELSSKQQDGQTVYTSRPTAYTKGCLWIVEEDISEYVEDRLVTSTTSGIYYVIKNDSYVQCTLPENYTDDTIYYRLVSFDTGALLQATKDSASNPSGAFNLLDWKDTNPSMTQVVNNITQYFGFNASTGLKIGQTNERFYVNISSTKLGFYDNSDPDKVGDNPNLPGVEVVSISNQSANIDNVIVEGSATFDCNTTFNGNISISDLFMFQLEDNGSLSLVITKPQEQLQAEAQAIYEEVN